LASTLVMHSTGGDKVFKTMEDYHGVVLMGDGQKGKGGKLFFNPFGPFLDGGVGIGIENEIEVFHGTVRSDEEVATCAEVKACFGQWSFGWKAFE